MRIVLFLLALLFAAYIGYPYYTLYQLDRALLDDDQVALAEIVDFPQVRADLKGEIKTMVVGKAEAKADKRPILGAIGAAVTELVAPPVIDSSVESMVTPEAILNNPTVVEHRRNGESFANFITYAFFSGPKTFTFDLKDPAKPDSPKVTAIMKLEGLSWRVVNVESGPLKL